MAYLNVAGSLLKPTYKKLKLKTFGCLLCKNTQRQYSSKDPKKIYNADIPQKAEDCGCVSLPSVKTSKLEGENINKSNDLCPKTNHISSQSNKDLPITDKVINSKNLKVDNCTKEKIAQDCDPIKLNNDSLNPQKKDVYIPPECPIKPKQECNETDTRQELCPKTKAICSENKIDVSSLEKEEDKNNNSKGDDRQKPVIISCMPKSKDKNMIENMNQDCDPIKLKNDSFNSYKKDVYIPPECSIKPKQDCNKMDTKQELCPKSKAICSENKIDIPSLEKKEDNSNNSKWDDHQKPVIISCVPLSKGKNMKEKINQDCDPIKPQNEPLNSQKNNLHVLPGCPINPKQNYNQPDTKKELCPKTKKSKKVKKVDNYQKLVKVSCIPKGQGKGIKENINTKEQTQYCKTKDYKTKNSSKWVKIGMPTIIIIVKSNIQIYMDLKRPGILASIKRFPLHREQE